MRAVRARIAGRVQGVGYRAWAERTAASLGLTGWVRNRRDGSVEAVFQGSPEAVDKMLERCRTGPGAASVTEVAFEDVEKGAYSSFDVHPTI